MYILSIIRNWLFPKKETPKKEKYEPLTQVIILDMVLENCVYSEPVFGSSTIFIEPDDPFEATELAGCIN